MIKKNILNSLTIITPFKEENNIRLEKTISCLYNQKINILINHLVIYDYSCNFISAIKKKYSSKKNYLLKFVFTNKKGI